MLWSVMSAESSVISIPLDVIDSVTMWGKMPLVALELTGTLTLKHKKELINRNISQINSITKQFLELT